MDGNRREGGPNNFGPQSPVDMKPDASLLSTSPTSPSLPTTSYHNYNPIASPQTPQVIFFICLADTLFYDNCFKNGQNI